MELVAIVIGLALVQYVYFTLRCGQTRGRLGIPAPATTGAPEFERRLRVQENTIEQLVIFVPALLLFAQLRERADRGRSGSRLHPGARALRPQLPARSGEAGPRLRD